MEVKRGRIEVLDDNGKNIYLTQVQSFIGYTEVYSQKDYYIGYYRYDRNDYVLVSQRLTNAEFTDDKVHEVRTYEELEKEISTRLGEIFVLTEVFTNYHALTTFKED